MEDKEILGCFVKIGFDPTLKEEDFQKLAAFFCPYIWGERGIAENMKKLKAEDYGKDLVLALFEFHVKPTNIELQYLKEIGSFHRKDKSIGIPIIINDENFFNKTEAERYEFLKTAILRKMDLLADKVKKRKMDTKMEQLKSDLEKILALPYNV